MCEFQESNCNGFGDMWWTDKCTYFSSIHESSRPSKTNYMIFTSKGKSYNKHVSNIKIDGNIQQVNKTKFLGIIIEQHLNWATHISHLCNIIARNVGILQKLQSFCSDLCIENSIPFIDIIAPTIGAHYYGQIHIIHIYRN